MFRSGAAERDIKFTRKYLRDLKLTGSVRRSKQTNVILNKIIKYNGSDKVEFSEITQEFLDGLKYYMRDKIGNHQNTIRKDFERLKMVFAEAEENKMLNHNPFDKYKLPPRQKTKKDALTYEQIKAIERLDLDLNSDLYHVRNYFMFSFYNAGIRFGDLCRLKWKNFKLNEYSFNILKDYRTSGSEEDYIFPILDTSKDLSIPSVFDSEKSSKMLWLMPI